MFASKLNSLDYGLRVALIAGAAGFLLTFATTDVGRTVRLLAEERGTGEVTLSLLLLLSALVIGFLVTGISYRRNQPDAVIITNSGSIQVEQRASWLARLVTATAAGLLLVVVTLAGIFITDLITPGLVLSQAVALTIVTLYAGGVSFALAYWSAHIDAVNLLILAGLAGLTGIIIAALAVGDPDWWQRSLSYLGSTETAGIYFNVAIIITGLLVLAINQETVVILKTLVRAERLSVDYFLVSRFYLLIIPVCIMGVGLFPTRITPLSDFLHNLSSHLMLVFFLIMMWFTVNRRDSFHSPTFRQWSRLFTLVILFFLVLMILEIINYVAFELLIFVPMGIWLLLYQLQVRDFAFKGQPAEISRPRPQTALAIYALRAGLISAGLGGILAFAGTSRGEMIALINPAADTSISRMLLMLSIVLGVGVTAFAYRRFVLEEPELSEAERKALANRGFWIARTVIAATAGLVLFFATAIGIVITNQLFPGVAFVPSNAIVIVASYGAVIGFALAYWAGRLDNVNLIILAGITMLLGVVLGALVIGDPEWWTVSLSYLGSAASPVMGFFNYGTLLTGLILLIVNLDTAGLLHVLADEGRISPDYFKMVRWLLVLIPLGLIGVALMPRQINSVYNVLHNTSAMVMVLLFMLLAFLVVARQDTIFDRQFIRVSRILAVSIPILYVLYIVNILTYVSMELLLALPIGLWLLFFQREVRAFARSENPPSLDMPDNIAPDAAT